jgi:ribonuclease HI
MSDKAILFIDGASSGNPGPSGVGIVLKRGKIKKEFSRYIGITTNNVAEYLSLTYGLQEALFQGIKKIVVKTDSELLANQIKGLYKIKNKNLRIFYDLNRHLISGFSSFKIEYVPRGQNKLADKLASEAIFMQTMR